MDGGAMTLSEAKNNMGGQEQPVSVRTQRSGDGAVGGLVLIMLGLLFLGDRLIPGFHFGDYWPLILVAIGIGILWKGYRERS
jgi:LiaI-LiaF-like transmembrane region